MNATILCPGPSVLNWEGPGDLVIGVNRAATLFPVDWWAAGDPPALDASLLKLQGSPRLFSTEFGLKHLSAVGHPWSGPTASFESLFSYLDPSTMNAPWTMFTFTAAIVFAASLGTKEISCFGCDWNGTADFDGVEAGGNRSEDRWRDERFRFGVLADVLKQRGIHVERRI